MKSIRKRIATLAVALILAMTMIPAAVVEAAIDAPKSVTLYRTDKSSQSYVNIYISGLTSKQSVVKSSIKSSNKTVASPYCLSYYTNTSKGSFFNGQAAFSDSSKMTNISLMSQKSGTSTISYKIGNKTYKTKVIVKPYTNPIKSISLFGIKNGKTTNLAGLMKSKSYTSVKLPATKKKQTIKVTAASGWKISNINFYNATGHTYSISYPPTKPAASASLYVGTVTKGKGGTVMLTMVNTSTKGTLNIQYDIV
ncbi:MAG: hypothetical protein Q4C77_17735 [Eubacteriales bacterium]|nr:hypothetical protein [Eubacteriales bacterium]